HDVIQWSVWPCMPQCFVKLLSFDACWLKAIRDLGVQYRGSGRHIKNPAHLERSKNGCKGVLVDLAGHLEPLEGLEIPDRLLGIRVKLGGQGQRRDVAVAQGHLDLAHMMTLVADLDRKNRDVRVVHLRRAEVPQEERLLQG